MSRPLIAQYQERAAWQCGHVLLDLLLAREALDDEVWWALWTESGGDVLAWLLRTQRRVMDKVPAAHHQEFVSGAIWRFFDDYE
jgi:hypothetical protein